MKRFIATFRIWVAQWPVIWWMTGEIFPTYAHWKAFSKHQPTLDVIPSKKVELFSHEDGQAMWDLLENIDGTLDLEELMDTETADAVQKALWED